LHASLTANYQADPLKFTIFPQSGNKVWLLMARPSEKERKLSVCVENFSLRGFYGLYNPFDRPRVDRPTSAQIVSLIHAPDAV
jgi:hypothetical protein